MKRNQDTRLFFIFLMGILATFVQFGCGESEPDLRVIETGNLTDIDGNEYMTVKIGDQWWMAEDLRVTKFRDGVEIPKMQSNEMWQNANSPAYCRYQDNPDAPGLLYNYFTIQSDNEIAPEGWHVPTDEEWKKLEDYIGIPAAELDEINWRGINEGDKLKKQGLLEWTRFGDVWATDEFGFSARSGSCRFFRGEFGIPALRGSGFWWTSSEVDNEGFYRYLDYKKSGIFRYTAHTNYGFSIRCVRD